MSAKIFQKRDLTVLTLIVILAAVFLVPSETRMYAQVAGATLSGTVTDASGAAVPNAQVSIKNTATGVSRGVSADSAGFYTAPNVLPGSYQVTFSAPGFTTEVSNGVSLTVGAQQVLNATLRVGQVSQQVTVTGEAPTVQLASSTLSAVVEAPQVVGLPLNGRSWTDLANLQPGVAGVETQVAFGDSGRGNRGFGAQLSISGSRPQENNYRLDGISINDYANGGPGSVLGGNLGVDAVEEFSVLTSSYSAEYGKTSGGVVNAISRAGTNTYHGSAYEFLRNSALDARNFFDPATVPAFRQNQFGASIGGPIKKDKTFFFGDYEGIRRTKGVSRLDVVPSLAVRGLMPDGKTHTAAILCSNPAGADPSSPCSPSAPDYSGYTVAPNPDPVTQIDKSILPWLGIYPLPNGPTIGNGDVANYNFVGHRIVREDYFTTRVDHHFSQKDSIFATYMFDRTPFTSDEPLGVVLLGAITKRQIVAIEETHTFSPSLVNTVRLGYNRDFVNNNQAVRPLNPLAADASLAAVPGQFAPGCQCPDGITFMEGGLGGTPAFLYRWNSYQVYDDAFFTRGLHSFKFGFGFERDQDNQWTLSEKDGTFKFGDMNSLLTNQPSKLRATLPGNLTERGMRESIIGAYFQDDWRFRPNLTLNLGLRYEMSTVPFDVHGQTSNIYNLTDALPVCGKLAPGCGSAGPYFFNPTLRNFAPRIGFAWDPFRNGKTAVRGGFGIFDSLPMLYQYITLNGRASPFFQILGSSNLDPGSFPSAAFTTLVNSGTSDAELGAVEPHPKRNYVMQWNLNIQREIFRDLTATIGYVGSHGVHQPFRVDEADMVLPTLTPAGYLFPQVDVNGNIFVPGVCNTLDPSISDPASCAPPSRINENAGSIRYLNWAGSSFYNALQLGVLKRLNHGFQVQGSFTWGKSIDTNSGVIAGDTFSNSISSLQWFDLKRLTRGLSDFDVRRTLVLNATWMVSNPKSITGALAWPLSGWQLSTIFKANDGVPFSALFGTGGDPTGSLSSDDYAFPERVLGCNPIDVNFRKNPNGPIYVNPSCFQVPSAPDMAYWQGNCDPAPPSVGGPVPFPQCFNLRGNAGRNIMIGPGLMNLDFSVFKNNPIRAVSENFNVQFRAEFFNVLNHANFGVPDLGDGNDDIFDGTGAVNPTAGLLTRTTTDPREIQFAIKVIW